MHLVSSAVYHRTTGDVVMVFRPWAADRLTGPGIHGETTKRANEVKPDLRLDVMECVKAEGTLGPVMVC